MENKKINKSRLALVFVIIVFVVIAAAICSALLLNNKKTINNKKPHSAVAVSTAKTKAIDVEFDSSASYSHAVTENKIFFFNAENVKITSMTGSLDKELSLKISKPIIDTCGNYALISDKNGTTSCIFNGAKPEKTYELEEKIIIAKINRNGYTLFVTTDSVHKCAVIVKSPSGEEVFKWKSGSLSVLAADISDNNRDIAVTTLSTDDGIIASNVYMFNITKNKPFTNDVYNNEIFSAIEYNGNNLCCIGMSEAVIYNGYGKCIGTIDYGERELITYATDKSLITLVFADSSVYANGSMICSYNQKGALSGSFSIDSAVKFIDCRDGNIAVDNNRVISVLNNSCKEKFQINTGTSLSDFKFIGGSASAVGISATGAEIISVSK